MALYMHIPNINGNVTAEDFENWIELMHLHQGLHRHVKASIAGDIRNRIPGNAYFPEIRITKKIDSSSTELSQKACEGEVIPELKLVATRISNNSLQPHLEYTLSNVLLSKIEKFISGQSAHEVISFSYTKIEERYTAYDADQTASSPQAIGYDIEAAEVL